MLQIQVIFVQKIMIRVQVVFLHLLLLFVEMGIVRQESLAIMEIKQDVLIVKLLVDTLVPL